MDKLVAMRTFVEIVDRGSLTAAAKALGRSSPTMVRTLAELEEALGVVLLRRTTRRMSLTEEGGLYLERCRRILADVEDAEASLGSTQLEPRGRLRITAPVLFGQMHVAPAVADFVRRYPGVKVELVLLDRVVNLVEEGFDVAVRIGPLVDSTLIARSVGRMRRVVCASPALLERVGIPERPEVLAEHPCVIFSGLSSPRHWKFVDERREVTVAIDGSLSVNQAAAAVQACAEGLGFGQFLYYQAAPALAAKHLQIVLEAFERPAVPVSLLYADARLLTSRVRAFIDWMTRHFGETGSFRAPPRSGRSARGRRRRGVAERR